jgi:hypothetical protein
VIGIDTTHMFTNAWPSGKGSKNALAFEIICAAISTGHWMENKEQ